MLMKNDKAEKARENGAKDGGRAADPRLDTWETPRILWTEKVQTLAYQCSSGPAPVSGSDCPP